jgi:hypothetical protein
VTRPPRVDGRIAATAVLILLGICIAELVVILALNDGHLVYSLDDAAIHLSVAENIAHGQYGVNAGEFSAPSSSIAWPFLMAPFTVLGVGDYAPLMINVPVAVATLLVCLRLLARPLAFFEQPRERTLAYAIAILFIPLANIVGLLFTGMEHSLQVLVSALTLFGLVREQETRKAPWWLWAAIVFGPLVRYENLALAVPALIYLALHRHYSAVAGCAVLMSSLLLGFSVFLHLHGLGWLPSSVIVKSSARTQDGMAAAVLRNVASNVFDRQGRFLALGWLVLLAIATNPRRPSADRQLGAWAASALTLHFVAGTFGWYYRYEIYIWATTVLSLLYLFGDSLRRLARRGGAVAVSTVGAVSLVAAWPYAGVLFTTPIACNNIYQQQYQMHRFLSEYWDAPAAVNDLGWTSYRNDRYVLDLYGLGNLQQVIEAKRDGGDWMTRLARQHDVSFAMIYPRLVGEPPAGWIPLGELHLGRTNYSAFDPMVSFFALDAATADRARRLLPEFQKTLPVGVRFQAR